MFIASLLVIITFILSLDKCFLPSVKEDVSKSISAQRVKADIEVISKEPHLIEHPQQRDRVWDYLYDRLTEIGLNVCYYRYDSILDRFGRSMDISNLYSVCEP